MSSEGSSSSGAARVSPRGEAVRWMLLIVLALACRLIGIHRTSVWSDEAFTLLAADMPWGDVLGRLPWVESNPPLHFVLVKLWGLVSESATWHRLLSVLTGLGGVVFIVLWVRMFDRRAGWMAGTLTAVCPIFCHYSQEIRGYTLLYTTAAAAFYLAERDIRTRSRSGPAWSVVLAVGAWTHFVGVLSALSVVAYWLLRRRQLRVRLSASLRLAILGLLIGPLGLLLASSWSAKKVEGYWIPYPDARHLRSTFEELLGVRWLEQWRGDPAPLWREIVVLVWRGASELCLGTVLALSILTARRELRQASRAIAAGGLVLIGLFLAVSMGLFPVLIGRTGAVVWIPVLALFALSASPAYRPRLGGWGTAALSTLAVLWGGLWIAVYAEGHTLRPPDADLFRYVQDRIEPLDHVICFPDTFSWSAAYFLQDDLKGERLHTRKEPTFRGQSPVRMLPLAERHDPRWFDRITEALTSDLAGPHPGCVWVLDGTFSARMDPDCQRMIEWLSRHYRPAESVVVDPEWGLAASRFVPGTSP